MREKGQTADKGRSPGAQCLEIKGHVTFYHMSSGGNCTPEVTIDVNVLQAACLAHRHRMLAVELLRHFGHGYRLLLFFSLIYSVDA